jgi:glyoxylase-like metal-dependent hydrolase (beta-lactamase superfamily II)
VSIAPDLPAGIARVPLPVGVNRIESVNAYVLADGDRVTLVDCGVWRAEPDDDGMRALEKGLRTAGYEVADVSRIVVTHAHIDHYGLAGRLMELSGAELCMHTMTDLDCEKYRHPDTARARRRDTYADHGVPPDEIAAIADTLGGWMPYLHSVVEASHRLRGGERIVLRDRTLEVFHTPGHSLGHVCLWSPSDRVLFSGDHLLPGVTPPVTFERGFDADPLRSYLTSLQVVAGLDPDVVLPGHGEPFREGRRRAEAIARNKHRRLEAVRAMIEAEPCTVTDLTDRLVAKAVMSFQRNLALTETLAHIACLRWRGVVERRARADASTSGTRRERGCGEPDVMTSRATVATERPERYVKHLVDHLARKLSTRLLDDGTGEIVLDVGRCLLRADGNLLLLNAESPGDAGLARVCDVVGRHLLRFGAREDLRLQWGEPASHT